MRYEPRHAEPLHRKRQCCAVRLPRGLPVQTRTCVYSVASAIEDGKLCRRLPLGDTPRVVNVVRPPILAHHLLPKSAHTHAAQPSHTAHVATVHICSLPGYCYRHSLEGKKEGEARLCCLCNSQGLSAQETRTRPHTSHPGGRPGRAGTTTSLQATLHTRSCPPLTWYCPYLPQPCPQPSPVRIDSVISPTMSTFCSHQAAWPSARREQENAQEHEP